MGNYQGSEKHAEQNKGENCGTLLTTSLHKLLQVNCFDDLQPLDLSKSRGEWAPV